MKKIRKKLYERTLHFNKTGNDIWIVLQNRQDEYTEWKLTFNSTLRRGSHLISLQYKKIDQLESVFLLIITSQYLIYRSIWSRDKLKFKIKSWELKIPATGTN